MLARLQTFSLFGIDAVPVEVEVDVSARLSEKASSAEGLLIRFRNQ